MCDELLFAAESNDDVATVAMTAQSAPVRAPRRVRVRRVLVRAPRLRRAGRAPDRVFYAPIALAREG